MSEPSSRVDGHRVTVPGTTCYWGLLDASCAAQGPAAQDFRLERLLPQAVEELQIGRTRLADGRVLLAALPRSRMDELRREGQLGPRSSSLRPDGLPAELAELGIPDEAAGRIELLLGTYEAAPRRAARRWVMGLLAGGMVLSALLSLTGALRRGGVYRATADEFYRQADRLALASAGPGVGAEAVLPARVRLTAEWRRLRTASGIPGEARGQDVLPVAEALWRTWPASPRVQMERIRLSAERIELRGTTLDLASAEALKQALDGLEAGGSVWRSGPLQARSGADSAGFTFVMTRTPVGATP